MNPRFPFLRPMVIKSKRRRGPRPRATGPRAVPPAVPRQPDLRAKYAPLRGAEFGAVDWKPVAVVVGALAAQVVFGLWLTLRME